MEEEAEPLYVEADGCISNPVLAAAAGGSKWAVQAVFQTFVLGNIRKKTTEEKRIHNQFDVQRK